MIACSIAETKTTTKKRKNRRGPTFFIKLITIASAFQTLSRASVFIIHFLRHYSTMLWSFHRATQNRHCCSIWKISLSCAYTVLRCSWYTRRWNAFDEFTIHVNARFRCWYKTVRHDECMKWGEKWMIGMIEMRWWIQSCVNRMCCCCVIAALLDLATLSFDIIFSPHSDYLM